MCYRRSEMRRQAATLLQICGAAALCLAACGETQEPAAFDSPSTTGTKSDASGSSSNNSSSGDDDGDASSSASEAGGNGADSSTSASDSGAVVDSGVPRTDCSKADACKNDPDSCGACCAADATCGGTMCRKSGVCCTPPATVPGQQYGGLAYANWDYGTPRLSSLATTICFVAPPSNSLGTFYQLYDFEIDGIGNYHGLQASKAGGTTLIFSRFGTVDKTNIRVGPGATDYAGTNEGPYVSLRMNYPFGVGCYVVRVARMEASGEADWFNMYIAPQGGAETYVGGIKFPRKTAGVAATYQNGGGSWIEYYSPTNSAYLNPYAHITLSQKANGGTSAIHVNSAYAKFTNADVYYAKGLVHMETGEKTPRCHAAGVLF